MVILYNKHSLRNHKEIVMVPEEIRNIERPDHTVVVERKTGYAVRLWEKDEFGNTILGPVVGHIINGAFVENVTDYVKPDPNKPFMLSYGGAALVLLAALPIYSILLKVFPVNIATQILLISCLKVLYPSVTSEYMATLYKESYLSAIIPGCGLSGDTVDNLYHEIGLNKEAIEKFNNIKFEKILTEFHVIYVDGTSKVYVSKYNPLSRKTYKPKYKDLSVINLLLAYSPEEDDVLCTTPYPGSFSDTSVFRRFLVENDITKGILFGDKAFLGSTVKKLKEESPEEFSDLHYIGIMKSNDKKLQSLQSMQYQGGFDSKKGNVFFKKYYDEGTNTWLYSFKNMKMSHRQENKFAEKELSNDNKESFGKDYAESQDSFGVINIESDLEFDLEVLYMIIIDRWSVLSEKIFYPNIFAHPPVQADFSRTGKAA